MFYRFPVRIFETDVGAVTAGAVGGPGGWVSGTIANLAASANVAVDFDLGADWAQYPLMQIFFNVPGPSTGVASVQLYGGDTVGSTARRIGFANTSALGTTFLTINSSSGPQTGFFRPMGRYLRISATNNDATNAVGPTGKITVAQYPC